jgi:hypothetical protein
MVYWPGSDTISVGAAATGLQSDNNLDDAIATTGITINNAGSVDGTNAPYIQLLPCKKN